MLLTDANPPPPPNKDDLKIRAKVRIAEDVNSLFERMKLIFIEDSTLVWKNPDGLTPQEVFDSFGTDAGELTRLATILKKAVNDAIPGTFPNPSPAYTVNKDGTVTVG